MAYLFYLPSLLCGLAIGIEDVRRHHVPAPWVLVGSLAQLISNIIAAAVGNTFFTVLQSMLFALLSLGVMALLALARSSGLGANEIKAMAPAGLAVGMCGLPAVIIWWLLIPKQGNIQIIPEDRDMKAAPPGAEANPGPFTGWLWHTVIRKIRPIWMQPSGRLIILWQMLL